MPAERVATRAGWGRRMGLAVAALAVSGALHGAAAQAGGDRPGQRWQTLEEIIQSGQLAFPASVLEVRLQYDADATPSLRITDLVIKRGYAPQQEPADSGYVLSLHAATGDALSAVTFHIPTRVFDPPPLTGEMVEEEPLILRAVEFALTVPMDPRAVELRVTDPQGVRIIQRSLREVPVRIKPLHFRSLRPRSALPA